MGGKPKGGPVPPCVVCGTTGGRPWSPGSRPRRVDVARFGFAGEACQACYERLRQREKSRETRRPPTEGAPPPPPAPAPAETVPHKRVAAVTLGADYSDEEREFLRAMDAYMVRTGRRFPALTEVFTVLLGLGYRKG